MDEKNKKGAKTTHNACVAYRPSDRFARISVYKRDVHINSLYTYVHIYISLFLSMQRRDKLVTVRNTERKREGNRDFIATRMQRQSRVAIRDFSGYQQVRIKGEKDTKRSNSREAAAPGYEAYWWGFRVTGETGGVTRLCPTLSMARRNRFDARRNSTLPPGQIIPRFGRWKDERMLYIMVYLDGKRERIVLIVAIIPTRF